MHVTNRLLPLLKASSPGSSIINITSIEAYRGIPNCSVYAAAKWGITGFTKSLALELAPLGIRVNDIAPETTDTPQTPIDYMVPPENREHVQRWVPLGRFGHPDDCAGAALYLASPLASWVTGTAINVDGGSLAAAGWIRDIKRDVDQHADRYWQRNEPVSGAMNKLIDEAALRHTAEIYAQGADRKDKQLWRSVLANDCRIEGPGFRHRRAGGDIDVDRRTRADVPLDLPPRP